MSSLGDVFKRLLVGRPMRSTQLGEQLLPKKIALPVFASDALSSVAYATEEILLVLSAGGLALMVSTADMLDVVGAFEATIRSIAEGKPIAVARS